VNYIGAPGIADLKQSETAHYVSLHCVGATVDFTSKLPHRYLLYTTLLITNSEEC